jgi:uncharacterized membrane protein YedE/YeeE
MAVGRQEDQAMFGFITRQASSVTAQRRPRVPVDTFPGATRSSVFARQAVGAALVAFGERVAGEMPAGHASRVGATAPSYLPGRASSAK